MWVNSTRSHGSYNMYDVVWADNDTDHNHFIVDCKLLRLCGVTVVCCCVGLRAPIVWTAVSILSGLCQVPHSLGLHDTAASV